MPYVPFIQRRMLSSSVMLLIKSKARIGVNNSLGGTGREKGRGGEKIRKGRKEEGERRRECAYERVSERER